jgi:RNA polymerase sigma-70 factor (ECF subfamily)
MTPTKQSTREVIEQLFGQLRPKLHRYCARMTCSMVDGEDIVQEALLKAIEALPESEPITQPEGWLFRIAHNTALDFLRRNARLNSIGETEDPDTIIDSVSVVEQRESAAMSLRTLMRLPVAQRSTVILMDVLGYSLEEVHETTDLSIPAVKAALHRGRARLRRLMQEPDDTPPLLEPERSLLAAYVERFNARDFDAIRLTIADEVRLDLVNKLRRSGKANMGEYFQKYDTVDDWHLVRGLVDGRPAAVAYDPNRPSPTPTYVVLLKWADGRIVHIQDFRFARYAIESADIRVIN